MEKTTISSKALLFKFDIKEIWSYRELLIVFVKRDLKIRYRQTFLGVAWLLIPPLLSAGIFSVIFGGLFHVPSDNLPYPLFILAGLIPWNFFTSGVTNGTASIVGNSGMIQKIYFPRILLPLSSILVAGFDFLIVFSAFLFITTLLGYVDFTRFFLITPLFLVSLFNTTFGLSLITSAINVRFRDIRLAINYIIQLGLFVTPVIYPLSVVPDYRKYLLLFNPLAGAISSFRRVFTPTPMEWTILFASVLLSFFVLFIGLLIFRRTEKTFADTI